MPCLQRIEFLRSRGWEKTECGIWLYENKLDWIRYKCTDTARVYLFKFENSKKIEKVEDEELGIVLYFIPLEKDIFCKICGRLLTSKNTIYSRELKGLLVCRHCPYYEEEEDIDEEDDNEEDNNVDEEDDNEYNDELNFNKRHQYIEGIVNC